MKRDTKQLRGLGAQERHSALFEAREKLRQLRFNLSGGRMKNVREVRQTRRHIARLLTLLHGKEPA